MHPRSQATALRGPEHTVLIVLRPYCQTVPNVRLLQAQQTLVLILPVLDPPPPEQRQGSGSYTRRVPGRPPVPGEAEAWMAGARLAGCALWRWATPTPGTGRSPPGNSLSEPQERDSRGQHL